MQILEITRASGKKVRWQLGGRRAACDDGTEQSGIDDRKESDG